MKKRKSKTILILGNGFDIAHGLPTKYGDFLEFCEKVEAIWDYTCYPSSDGSAEEKYRKICIEAWETDAYLKERIFEDFCKRKIQFVEGGFEVTSDNPVLSEIHANLKDNIWYKYFNNIYKSKDINIRGENWIDFESEIRFVIQSVDEHSPTPDDSWNAAIELASNAISIVTVQNHPQSHSIANSYTK